MTRSNSNAAQNNVYSLPIVDIDMYDDAPHTHDERPDRRTAARPPTQQRRPVNDDMRLSAIDKLTLSTEVSIRYHQRRKIHYNTVYKAMVFTIIMLAAIGFMSISSQPRLVGLATIGIAVMTLVWNVSQKSRDHDLLRNRYQNLLEQIRMTTNPNERDLYNWRTIRLNIQSDEPPMHWALVNDCYYDVARSWDLRPKRKKCPMLLRPLMNWIRF